jgi:2,5-dioxopentanoate dehydrogenase
MTLTGRSIVAGQTASPGNAAESHGASFTAMNPATGQPLGPDYVCASERDVERATVAAEKAFAIYGKLSGKRKAALLREIANGLEQIRDTLVERANLETALPIPRLQGEVARTANQLRLFADVAEEGSWVMARIDHALPTRTPLPRPDLRSMLRPLGPVVVFGASNFPLAYSVAGGDTASALAAGNPVIVKAHPAHPGTSELVGHVVACCVRAADLPAGVFSLLFDKGTEVGTVLVRHPGVKAVGFTGSLAGGRALMDIASARPDPIPCFAEMGSTNPVFVLPGILRAQREKIAKELFSSITLGAGQFCTKPGLVFLPEQEMHGMAAQLRSLVSQASPFTMLTQGIAAQFSKTLAERVKSGTVQTITIADDEERSKGFTATATLLSTDAKSLEANPNLSGEVFGPTSLFVACDDHEQTLRAAESLKGHLTASVIGTEEDLANHRDLIEVLERKVGRLICNGYPTGVEVSHAIVHGGPYPATSDGRSTSVGSRAIFRFSRPVCYQNFPQSTLPEELHDDNPLHIWRMIDGAMTQDPSA